MVDLPRFVEALLVCIVTLVLTSPSEAAKKRKAEEAKPVDAAAIEPEASENPETTAKPSSIDPATLESDKDLAKYVKALRKKFKKEDGYYVVRMIEVGVQPDPSQAGAPKDSNVVYKPYTNVNFEMLTGREAAVARIVEFVGENNPPWRKKSTSASKKDDRDKQAAPPAPKRDWQPVNWFPNSEEGLKQAETARNQAQQTHDAEVKAIQDRNKPPCACKKSS